MASISAASYAPKGVALVSSEASLIAALHPAVLFHLLSRRAAVLLARHGFFQGARARRFGFVGVAVGLAGRRGRLGQRQIAGRVGGLGLDLRLRFLGRLRGRRGLQRNKLRARDIFGLGHLGLLAVNLGRLGDLVRARDWPRVSSCPSRTWRLWAPQRWPGQDSRSRRSTAGPAVAAAAGVALLGDEIRSVTWAAAARRANAGFATGGTSCRCGSAKTNRCKASEMAKAQARRETSACSTAQGPSGHPGNGHGLSVCRRRGGSGNCLDFALLV